jgi:hypothetical protein
MNICQFTHNVKPKDGKKGHLPKRPMYYNVQYKLYRVTNNQQLTSLLKFKNTYCYDTTVTVCMTLLSLSV